MFVREAREDGGTKNLSSLSFGLFNASSLVLGHQCWSDQGEVLALMLWPPIWIIPVPRSPVCGLLLPRIIGLCLISSFWLGEGRKVKVHTSGEVGEQPRIRNVGCAAVVV